MLISKSVKLKWNSRNKNRYTQLGYTFTKMGDKFSVDIKDITDGCSAVVQCKCDYCGRTYTTKWQSYVKRKSKEKDCCNDVQCIEKKAKEQISQKYGVDNLLKSKEVQEKIKNTNILKYGVDNPFKSSDIQQKAKSTNCRKYGYESPMQNREVAQKSKETCMAKYGVDNFAKTDQFKKSMSKENNPNWKGGVEYHGHERATQECVYWRTLVYQRDRFTCQVCGAKSVKLNAHHIYNWKDNPELRYDINNGICMCEQCHILFHRIYKKRNNNKQQLDEFITNYGKEIC